MGTDISALILDNKNASCPVPKPIFHEEKKQKILGKKHKFSLVFKQEVEPNTLTDPPGFFNLRDQKFFLQIKGMSEPKPKAGKRLTESKSKLTNSEYKNKSWL